MPAKPKTTTPAPKTKATTTRAKSPARGRKAPSSPPSRGQTKTDLLISMMRRPGGSTSKEMEEATGWAPESVRGLIGTLKRRGTAVISTKGRGEPTVYTIPAEDVI